MARVKTRYVGVYYRYGKKRFLSDGRPDKCFDIHYKANGRYIWEKVGWKSEGYTLQDAIVLRGNRVKALRHPELATHEAEKHATDITIHDIWKIYEEKWLPNVKNRDSITNIYERHIFPRLGHRRLKDITTIEAEEFKQSLLHTPKNKQTEPIKKSTVKIIVSIAKQIINRAIFYNIDGVSSNPLANISISNFESQRERYLKPDEIGKIFDALKMTSCHIYYAAFISLHTGMRVGEIASIKLHDIDIESGIIYVSGKTGRRCAYISDELKKLLLKIIGSSTSQFLLITKQGKALSAKEISKQFTHIVNEIGLNADIHDTRKRVVFHTLRHTFCSWLAIKGVPLYTIGELVGHKTTEMTKRYAKLSPDCKKNALKHIENSFLK